MDYATMKMLQNRLKKKVGQTVQSVGIISQESIVVLVTGLKTLTNSVAVKWLQVKIRFKNVSLELPEVIFFLVCYHCTVESYYEHLLTSRSLNYTEKEHKDNLPRDRHLTISSRDPL